MQIDPVDGFACSAQHIWIADKSIIPTNYKIRLLISNYSNNPYGGTFIIGSTSIVHRNYLTNIVIFYELVYLFIQVVQFFHGMEYLQFCADFRLLVSSPSERSTIP